MTLSKHRQPPTGGASNVPTIKIQKCMYKRKEMGACENKSLAIIVQAYIIQILHGLKENMAHYFPEVLMTSSINTNPQCDC